MSLLYRTISAFPRGRTAEELLVLLNADFDPCRREKILGEIDLLLDQEMILRDRHGRWHPVNRSEPVAASGADQKPSEKEFVENDGFLAAVAATITARPAPAEDTVTPGDNAGPASPAALLRYYRSTLRSDPRGAIAETEDRHGISWQIATGSGALAPEGGGSVALSFALDALPAGFREALFRREGEENALAVGWPIMVGWKSGERVFWPAGMLSGEWQRTEVTLDVTIDADDVLVNSDWVKAAARRSSWSESALSDVFLRLEGIGLPIDDFTARIREAAAGAILTSLSPAARARRLDPAQEGIHNLFGLFLPTESSFTAGAARDLNRIAAWDAETLRQTALASVLGLERTGGAPPAPAINVGPLNAEQIKAVQNGCSAGLSVVTGPPGTGKSQVIVSMAASIMAAGGSVLVASRNHQALDAVEDRLTALAPDTPFLIRTLDPAKDVDQSFNDALHEIVGQPPKCGGAIDPALKSQLASLAKIRAQSLSRHAAISAAHLEMADIFERLEARAQLDTGTEDAPAVAQSSSLLQRLLSLLSLRRGEPAAAPGARPPGEGAQTHELRARLRHLRNELDQIGEPEDPVALTAEIADLVEKTVPAILAGRTCLSLEEQRLLGEQAANLEIRQISPQPDRALAGKILACRPLWLASILGTPRRIPLEPGLFDVVIFDEASQCDIASALPLMARARRAAVVGDNNQLHLFAQIGLAHDRNLMLAQSLAPDNMGRFAQSRRSLFSMADMTPNAERVMLKQQYRSAAPIVEYISSEYYGGRLRAAGDQNSLKTPERQRPGIEWTHVPAPRTPQRGNVNPAEAAAVIAHLEDLLNREGYDGTIGIVTPFRPQAARIWQEMKSRFNRETLEKAELRAGTVDSFQGQERDIIIFSPCLGPASASSALTFVQRDWRRLNVAISRARAVAHIFGDLDFARRGSIRSMQRLANWVTKPRPSKTEGVFDSRWERRMFEALKVRSLEPIPQYEIAGRRLDFALFGRGSIKLDLEVDGRHWHTDIDGNRKIADLWRDSQLKSLGWRVRRFWVDQLADDMEECLDIIERDLAGPAD